MFRPGLNVVSINDTLEFGTREYDRLMFRLIETGCRDFRINFIWRRLAKPGSMGCELNEFEVGKQKKILDDLPRESRVLAFISNAPQDVGQAYFHDRAVLRSSFSKFVKKIVANFPNVESWEIWNEPNASDFYLSRKLNDSHRPWSAQEFWEDVAVPGISAVREVNSGAKICLGALAEDGIIGHENKIAPISNQIGNLPAFKQYLSEAPHGQFYFIPRFLSDLVVAIKDSKAENSFDAWGCHPYPYFNIFQDRNTGKDINLANRTLDLVEDFLSATNDSELSNKQVWLTELGARNLDIVNYCRFDENAQVIYLEQVYEKLKQNPRIARGYWYKFEDRNWDLTQEKTFGLLNHEMFPKRSFLSFSKICNDIETPSVLYEDFLPMIYKGVSQLSEEKWDIRQDSIFSYVLPALGGEFSTSVAISAGHRRGDKLRILSKAVLRNNGNSKHAYGIFRFPIEPARTKISFIWTGEDENINHSISMVPVNSNLVCYFNDIQVGVFWDLLNKWFEAKFCIEKDKIAMSAIAADSSFNIVQDLAALKLPPSRVGVEFETLDPIVKSHQRGHLDVNRFGFY